MKDNDFSGVGAFKTWLSKSFMQFFSIWIKRNDYYDHAVPLAYARTKSKLALSGDETVLTDEDCLFESQPIVGPHEVVSCSFSRTINLGNYESVSISVFRSIPFHPGTKNADRAYDECKSWVSGKVSEQVKKVIDFRDKKNAQQQSTSVNKISY